MASLDGAREKVERAREHVDAIDAESRAFIRDHPYRVVRKYYAKTCHATFRFAHDIPAPVLRWGVLIGDVVHELSSALDHVAWQLARKTRPKPTRATAFPVCLIEDDWNSKRTRDMLQHIGPDDRTFIQSHQPYMAANRGDPKTHIFAMLRLLSRIDKHQVLNAAILLPLDTDIELINIDSLSSIHAVRDVRLYNEPVKQGAKFARVLLDEPCPDVDMNVELTMYIGLIGTEYGHMDHGRLFTILGAATHWVDRVIGEAEPRL